MAEEQQAGAVSGPEQTVEAEKVLIENFNKDLHELLKKYPTLAIGAQAVILPNGTIGAKPILVKNPEPEKVEEKKSDLASA